MKKYFLEFVRRGMTACGLGPMILAVLYLILQHQEKMYSLTVSEVCLGIFSLSALAFLAGGMNIVYQIEQLPLTIAIFIHGGVLYISYLITYLVNDWLIWGRIEIFVFSGIFILGYIIIWIIIYTITKRNTEKVNQLLQEREHV